VALYVLPFYIKQAEITPKKTSKRLVSKKKRRKTKKKIDESEKNCKKYTRKTEKGSSLCYIIYKKSHKREKYSVTRKFNNGFG
jgi:hypothetical protein